MVAVLQEVTHSMAQTKPWVRLLSVLGFLVTAGALTFVAIGSAVGGAAPGPLDLIIMIPMCTLFYLIPSLLLWNYASRIGEFLRGTNHASLLTALTAQKSFWKYLGILGLTVVIIYAVIFGLVIVIDFGRL